jgi:Na+/H+ antiporter NhaD/arsenite permease-like protein
LQSVEVAIFLGFASAIVDNVPLVAAAQALPKNAL